MGCPLLWLLSFGQAKESNLPPVNHRSSPRDWNSMRRSIILICLALLSACNGDEAYRYLTSGSVSWKLKQEIHDKHADVIDMKKLVLFEWDELFIFGPYAPQKQMCTALELAQKACEDLDIPVSTDDGEMVMVFRSQKKVVHSELHYRSHGNFILPKGTEMLPSQAAIFSVKPNGDLLLKEP
jgi:hypothetical protein